jgi:hypothetical protein
MSETHRPKTIDGYEVIGVEPDAACEYCGQRGDDAVYLMQGLFKGVGREPLHEACAAHWFKWWNAINKRGSQVRPSQSGGAYLPDILAQHSLIRAQCAVERSIRCG